VIDSLRLFSFLLFLRYIPRYIFELDFTVFTATSLDNQSLNAQKSPEARVTSLPQRTSLKAPIVLALNVSFPELSILGIRLSG
jgi:hypothetical protein